MALRPPTPRKACRPTACEEGRHRLPGDGAFTGYAADSTAQTYAGRREAGCQKNALSTTKSATTRNTRPSSSSWIESRDTVNLPLASL
jgi:hypothetical protein